MKKRLLGHLAQFGSFSSQSEVLCTQGLAYVLRTYEDARSALAQEVETRLGAKVGDQLAWHAEAVQADGGRPDLEARTTAGVPVVKIEAKLGAALTPEQLMSYASDLGGSEGLGVLLVLVPERRTEECARVTSAVLELPGPGPWPATEERPIAVAVISWDELFACLGTGGPELRAEVEQLEAMYRVLDGDTIAPIAHVEDLLNWRNRETDFVNLVDRVTRRLTQKLGKHNLLPMDVEPLEKEPDGLEPKGYRRRYVCPVPGADGSCFAIGVRDSFAAWVTPVWLRFHRRTGIFALIRQRIQASSLRRLESGGLIWIPLDVPVAVSSDQMVEALVLQAEEVMRVAYESE